MLDVWGDVEALRLNMDKIEAVTMSGSEEQRWQQIGRILGTVEAQADRLKDIQTEARDDRQERQVLLGRMELLERDRTEMRGMVAQMARDIAKLTEDVKPLRELMLKTIGGASVVGICFAVIFEYGKWWFSNR